MNKKAQQGPVSFIFSVLFFLIFFGIVGGTLLSLIGLASASVGLSGLEAFIFNNFGLWIILSLILGVFAFFYIGGDKK